MTPFVTPPTDNLYKFLTVSGLILLVLSVAAPLHFLRDVETMPGRKSPHLRAAALDEIIALGIEFDEKWAKEQQPLPPDATELQQQLDRKKKLLDRVAIVEGVEDEVFKRLHLTEPEPTLAEVEMLKSLREKLIDWQSADIEEWAYLEYAILVMICSRVGEWLGLVMALLGFALWWRRVQRWQDRMLRAEANKTTPNAKKDRSLFSRLMAGARARHPT